MDLLVSSPEGLACPRGGFSIDPWQPADVAVVTHAHGDHARPGSRRIVCTEGTAAILRRRFGPDAPLEPVPTGRPFPLGTTSVSLHPAGHVLGSAQVRVESDGEVWVVTGDYKRVADPTCAPFEVLRCDVLVTEATFALPIYRWETTASVVDEVLGWWREGRERGEARVLFCYALGKAQRLLAELVDRTEGPVYVHGAIDGLLEPYRAAGVQLAPTEHLGEKLRGRDLAGALVLAPPSAVGTPWMRRFAEAETALASGWMRLRGTRRRRSHDRGFALSDHADFPDLLRTIEESGAARVLATHGHAEELARLCRERGLEASAIRTAWEGEGDA